MIEHMLMLLKQEFTVCLSVLYFLSVFSAFCVCSLTDKDELFPDMYLKSTLIYLVVMSIFAIKMM